MALLLVVDDDAALRQLLCRHLARRGHLSISAGTGADAAMHVVRRDPEVAPLELRLPDADGLSLFQALRGSFAGAVRVIMTAHGNVRSAVTCLRAGIAEYLEEPFELDSLSALVERLGSGGDQTRTSPIGRPAIRILAHPLPALAPVQSLDGQTGQESIAMWGHAIGAACSTLGMRCEATGVSAKAVHDFRLVQLCGEAALSRVSPTSPWAPGA